MALCFPFHAAVLDRIEAGLASWDDDSTELERFTITESDRLPSISKQPNQPTARLPANTARAYCREWNRTGSCSNQSHQVGAEHVCAYCKLPDHTIGTRPTRPPANTSSTNSRKLRHGSLVIYWKNQGGDLSSEDLTRTS